MTIGVLTAMSVEHQQVASMMADTETVKHGPWEFLCGTVGPHRILLLQCGIGKVNAAAGTAAMLMQLQPDCVISTGVAGGIDEQLRVMDVVVGTEMCYHDVTCGLDYDPGQVQGLPPYFPGDSRLATTAQQLNTEVRMVPGRICTGDQFITDRQQLYGIKAMHPTGLAVDMESAAIAQVCHLWGVPFLSLRIISDTPGKSSEDEHYKQYMNFWQTMAEKSFAVTRSFLTSI